MAELLGNLTFGAGSGATIIQAISGFIIFGGALFLLWLVYRQLQYKYTVKIYSESAGGYFIESDKAREVKDSKDKSIIHHELKKHKGSWSGPIKNKYFIPQKKAFGFGYVVHMAEDEEGNLFCIMPPSLDYNEFHGISSADKQHASMSLKKSMERYTQSDFWDKYGNTILQIASISILIVFMLVVVRELGVFIDQVGAQSSALQNAVNSLNTQTISNAGNTTGVIT